MELGAGVGLPSFVVGRFAESMIISDYEQDLIENAQYNLRVNSALDDSDLPDIQAMKLNLQQSIKTAILDWSAVPIVDQSSAESLKEFNEFSDPVEAGFHAMDSSLAAKSCTLSVKLTAIR